jgi:hypothetical protein
MMERKLVAKNKGKGVKNIKLFENCTPMEEFIMKLMF